jgi:predicted N-acetyltransferase YhbS
MIAYRTGNDLDLDVVIELYRASTLGARRPVDDRPRMQRMLREANLVITAWDGEQLVGISRSLTDFSYAAYLADLAVRESHQRQGIGKELIRRTQSASAPATLILLAAPAAEQYYPHIGFTHHPQAWRLLAGEQIAARKTDAGGGQSCGNVVATNVKNGPLDS